MPQVRDDKTGQYTSGGNTPLNSRSTNPYPMKLAKTEYTTPNGNVYDTVMTYEHIDYDSVSGQLKIANKLVKTPKTHAEAEKTIGRLNKDISRFNETYQKVVSSTWGNQPRQMQLVQKINESQKMIDHLKGMMG